jgi:thiamine biosynthesis protein ThiS
VIRINNHAYKWKKGLDLESLLEELRNDNIFKDLVQNNPVLMIMFNGTLIPTDQYENTPVQKNDEIHLIPFASGG